MVKNNSLNNNPKIDINNISFDVGRMSFSKEPVELNNEHYKVLKIMDIRKNEYFGDIHMFLEQRSPFTKQKQELQMYCFYVKMMKYIFLGISLM